MPAKKKKSNEQTELLRQILAELQKLNANLASGKAMRENMQEPLDDSDSDELDGYE